MAKYVVFELAGEFYAIGIEKVRSIETMKPITRVPTTNPFVKGVINLRGVVVPVIDLRKRLGMPEMDPTAQTRIIILPQLNQEVGIVVDAAQNVVDIEETALQPPADSAGRLLYVESMAKFGEKVLSVLDLDGVMVHAS